MTDSVEDDRVRSFLKRNFSGLLPPRDPFFCKEWVGVAFDRNRYEQLAPVEWWKALTECSSALFGESGIYAIEKNALSASQLHEISLIINSKESIFEYLGSNDNFLRDQYLVGNGFRWACLLDQDVSLFGGDKEFMNHCFNKVGGVQYIYDKMVDDFIGNKVYSEGSSDEFILGFELYFKRLLFGG